MAGTSVARISSGDKPLSALLIRYEHDFAVGDALEMPPVRTLAIALRGLHKLVASDPAVLVGDLFHDRDRKALRALDCTHEFASLEQAVHRTSVQPRIATPQRAHVQHARIQIHAVQIRDLQLATRTRLHPLRVLDHVLIVCVLASWRPLCERCFSAV